MNMDMLRGCWRSDKDSRMSSEAKVQETVAANKRTNRVMETITSAGHTAAMYLKGPFTSKKGNEAVLAKEAAPTPAPKLLQVQVDACIPDATTTSKTPKPSRGQRTLAEIALALKHEADNQLQTALKTQAPAAPTPTPSLAPASVLVPIPALAPAPIAAEATLPLGDMTQALSLVDPAPTPDNSMAQIQPNVAPTPAKKIPMIIADCKISMKKISIFFCSYIPCPNTSTKREASTNGTSNASVQELCQTITNKWGLKACPISIMTPASAKVAYEIPAVAAVALTAAEAAVLAAPCVDVNDMVAAAAAAAPTPAWSAIGAAPTNRGPVGRKVHWAAKRLAEASQGASRCCERLKKGCRSAKKGAAKRLNKLAQSLGSNLHK